MADTLNLLPCPFCGNTELHHETNPARPLPSDYIMCDGQHGCGVMLSRVDTQDDNLEATWNRRSSSSVSEGELPELPEPFGTMSAEDEEGFYTAGQTRDYGKACYRAATKAAAPADAPLDQIPLPGGATLRREARTTGASGWLLYGRSNNLIRAMNLAEVELIDSTLAARRASSTPAIPGTGREKEHAVGEWMHWGEVKPEIYPHLPDGGSAQRIGVAASDGDARAIVEAHNAVVRRLSAPSHPSEAKAGEDA